MKTTLENAKQSVKYWYLVLILGIIFILVGIWCFFTPLASYLALAALFGMTFLVTGILETVYSLSNRKTLNWWGWSLASGLLDLLIGILLLSHPGITLIILPLFVGFAVMFRSVTGIAWSIELKRNEVKDWGVLLAAGILGVIFSFILLLNPVVAGLTIVFYTALAFIAIGISQIYLSWQLRKLKKEMV